MHISPGRGFIFVHIPKTGGTSMALALEARAMADDILIGDTPKAIRRRRRLAGVSARGRLWKHSRLSDIEGLVPRDAFAEMFVFTMVRNPWDRLVSYYHWLRAQSFDHPAVQLAKASGFEDFVMADETGRSLAANPVDRYLTDSAGVCHAGGFVRLEHLAEDLDPVCKRLGFRIELDRVNRSDRPRDWRPLYTDRMAERVAMLCAPDIARFGYRFDPD